MEVSFEVPEKIDCDVLVVGGGPAGIAAAVASARQGAKTALLEQYNCVGGMATVGLVGPFMTAFDADGNEQIVKGVFDELVNRMVDQGGAIHPSNVPAGTDYVSFIHEAHHNATPFDPESMKYVAMEMLLEADVDVRLHTHLISTQSSEKNTIESVIISDKGGLGLARAAMYVDTTGDGDLAAQAGNPFEKGRKQDGKLQPATMFLRVGNVDDKKVAVWVRQYLKPGERLFESLVAKAKREGIFPENCPRESVGMYRQPRKGEWRINTSRVTGIDGTNPESLTKAEIEGRRQAIALVKFFNEFCPGMEKAYLIDTGAQVGIRETRRIIGRYMLTREDVQQARRFDDAIARYSFFLDIHNPDGGGQESSQMLYIEGGPFFEIPYRCLVPSVVTNLLTAGRCISADHQANGAIRVMPACFATGEAAGVAAAMAAQTGCNPGDLNVKDLQSALRNSGCVL